MECQVSLLSIAGIIGCATVIVKHTTGDTFNSFHFGVVVFFHWIKLVFSHSVIPLAGGSKVVKDQYQQSSSNYKVAIEMVSKLLHRACSLLSRLSMSPTHFE